MLTLRWRCVVWRTSFLLRIGCTAIYQYHNRVRCETRVGCTCVRGCKDICAVLSSTGVEILAVNHSVAILASGNPARRGTLASVCGIRRSVVDRDARLADDVAVSSACRCHELARRTAFRPRGACIWRRVNIVFGVGLIAHRLEITCSAYIYPACCCTCTGEHRIGFVAKRFNGCGVWNTCACSTHRGIAGRVAVESIQARRAKRCIVLGTIGASRQISIVHRARAHAILACADIRLAAGGLCVLIDHVPRRCRADPMRVCRTFCCVRVRISVAVAEPSVC